MPTVVVIGAGVSGLAVALRLQERLPGADVIVLERAARPGGTTWTLRDGGFQVETGPNGFLDSKPTTRDLCREVGLGDQLVRASEAAGRNRYLFLDGRLRPLPGGFGALLKTDLLSWRGKLSLLMERLRRSRGAGDESIDAFARRRVGDEVAGLFADALVTGIYAGDPTLLSLPACFPRAAELERTYGSLLKGFAKSAKQRRAEAAARGEPYERGTRMWSFAGGLRVMVETLAERLRQPPLYGVTVRAVRKRPDAPTGWDVVGEGNDRWHADAVVLSCPAPEQAAQLADLDAELATRVAEIPYNRVAVVAVGYRREDVPGSLDGFGFIAPQRTRRDVLGVQWCSSIYPARAPDGAVLLRAMCGGWHRADVVDWDDGRLLAAVRAELRQAMGITAGPVFHSVVRWPRAIPQYHVGHLERVAWVERRLESHPGLFLGGNAYRGVALNDCTEQGAILAGRVRAFLGAGSTP